MSEGLEASVLPLDEIPRFRIASFGPGRDTDYLTKLPLGRPSRSSMSEHSERESNPQTPP